MDDNVTSLADFRASRMARSNTAPAVVQTQEVAEVSPKQKPPTPGKKTVTIRMGQPVSIRYSGNTMDAVMDMGLIRPPGLK